MSPALGGRRLVTGARRRLRGLVRDRSRSDLLGLSAVAALFLVGGALRLWFMLDARPAFLGFPDSERYILAAASSIFADPMRPGGYSLFVQLAHALSTELSATILLQHLLGLATAALLYLGVRGLGVGRGPALIPAAIVLLGGLQLFLEHAVLTDGLFSFLVAAALHAAVRSLRPRGLGWAAVAGLILGAATCVRSVGAFLLPVVALALLAAAGPWRQRLVAPALALLAAAVPIATYVIAQQRHEGYTGLVRGGGWALYGRVAEFADCSRFRPPPGTAQLCERTPPETRAGATVYLYGSSPARTAFGMPPQADGRVGAFARAAALHQPGDYARILGRDLWRLVAPDSGVKPGTGDSPTGMVNYLLDPAIEAHAMSAVVPTYYTTTAFGDRSLAPMRAYAHRAVVKGPVFLVLLILAVLGVLLGRGDARRGAVLFGLGTFVLAVMPVATLFYTARYTVPFLGTLGAGAAIGLHALLAQRSRA